MVPSSQKQKTGLAVRGGKRPADELWTFREVRRQTEQLCEPLEVEDFVIQSMPDVSPAKWHLAHTSWFFETFLLGPLLADYQPFHPKFSYLFNSYYNAVGQRVARGERGLLSRPSVKEVFDYRAWVDEQMAELLTQAGSDARQQISPLLALGLNHEQQHQELLLTDIKHVFACNPLHPVYRERFTTNVGREVPPLEWKHFSAGLYAIGHGGHDFAYDNECPRHKVYVEDFQLANRLATTGEFLEFMDDKGYERSALWLSDGWAVRCEQNWTAPLYWEKRAGRWWHMTLAGMRPVEEAEPVCHVSFYEADAFARWAGKRLPTEAEWELAASEVTSAGNFVESEVFHPAPPDTDVGMQQMFGDVWEWTCSPYTAYPGYRPPAGALGEYNGKFMCNQLVLRGGSCVTPLSHIRATYRNFFPPEARWQFMGIRLADG